MTAALPDVGRLFLVDDGVIVSKFSGIRYSAAEALRLATISLEHAFKADCTPDEAAFCHQHIGELISAARLLDASAAGRDQAGAAA